MAEFNILLISGHGDGDSGAVGCGYIEAEETIKIVKALGAKLTDYANIKYYPFEKNAFKDLGKGVFNASLSGIDYVLEVHLNSFNKSAHGTEIYITIAEKTYGVESKIMQNMSKYFTNRGVKRTNFDVIKYCKNKGVSSALLETCFIDNASDMKTYAANFNNIINAIADGIIDGFGLKEGSSTKPTTGGGGTSKPSGSTSTGTGYYPAFNDTSIVDGLKSIGVDSGKDNRKRIAIANGISGYTGTSEQNQKLLSLARKGKLKKPSGSTSTGTGYYPVFNNTSIVDGLKSIGVDSGKEHRKAIAKANGISGYTGTSEQNQQLLSLARKGKLKKA